VGRPASVSLRRLVSRFRSLLLSPALSPDRGLMSSRDGGRDSSHGSSSGSHSVRNLFGVREGITASTRSESRPGSTHAAADPALASFQPQAVLETIRTQVFDVSAPTP